MLSGNQQVHSSDVCLALSYLSVDQYSIGLNVEWSGIQLPGVERNSLFYAPICLLFTRLTPHFNISCKISTHFGEKNSDVIFSQSLRSFDFFLKVHLVDREEINLTTDHRDLHRVRNVDQDVLGGHNAHY